MLCEVCGRRAAHVPIPFPPADAPVWRQLCLACVADDAVWARTLPPPAAPLALLDLPSLAVHVATIEREGTASDRAAFARLLAEEAARAGRPLPAPVAAFVARYHRDPAR